MKKYLVIGNPIEHSLSPKLHNYWLQIYKIPAIYEKKKINNDEIESLILEIRKKKINGINVTVPFKNTVIPFLDELSLESKNTQSVNTIYLENDKVIGHNTDIDGFKKSIDNAKYSIVGKKVLILGSGGVVPSIIFALKKMNVSKIFLSNRTKSKAEKLKDLFNDIEIINWGEVPNFDIVINATSIGLNKSDKIELDFSNVGKNKLFYDLIYNPIQTNFLQSGEKMGNKCENGKMMFIYQASLAFKVWHGVYPDINNEIINLLDQ